MAMKQPTTSSICFVETYEFLTNHLSSSAIQDSVEIWEMHTTLDHFCTIRTARNPNYFDILANSNFYGRYTKTIMERSTHLGYSTAYLEALER